MIIELSELSNKCIEEMRENEKLIMSKEDKKKLFNAPCCSICNEPFKLLKLDVGTMTIEPVSLEEQRIRSVISIILRIVLFLLFFII